jgi:hypothetical protein
MARKLRLQYEGAIYHVMSRGDRREDIFHMGVWTHLSNRLYHVKV